MAINFNILALYVVTVITAIAVPGPVAVLVAGAGLAGGPLKALKTIFGTNSASLVLILLSALVVKGLFAINELAFDIVKLAGACYIAYIGWDMFRASSSPDDGPAAVQPRVGGFSKGFVMAISNPKDIIFFASFFPQFIGITKDTNASLALLTALWIILDFSTLMLVYLLVSKLLKPAIHQRMLRFSGVLLFVIATGGVVMASASIFRLIG
ncbi:LysE family translocator [Trinickia terrae]|uniref:LysE family translocator n=1 Tax=Trinickia terrae TaxID=2571161 RepID=A0A4U1IDZ4_9BURK|nr:LysE family translocator [Trinickia terrae]TKC91807.1 LysE family translocator [Trinickia terrae]